MESDEQRHRMKQGSRESEKLNDLDTSNDGGDNVDERRDSSGADRVERARYRRQRRARQQQELRERLQRRVREQLARRQQQLDRHKKQRQRRDWDWQQQKNKRVPRAASAPQRRPRGARKKRRNNGVQPPPSVPAQTEFVPYENSPAVHSFKSSSTSRSRSLSSASEAGPTGGPNKMESMVMRVQIADEEAARLAVVLDERTKQYTGTVIRLQRQCMTMRQRCDRIEAKKISDNNNIDNMEEEEEEEEVNTRKPMTALERARARKNRKAAMNKGNKSSKDRGVTEEEENGEENGAGGINPDPSMYLSIRPADLVEGTTTEEAARQDGSCEDVQPPEMEDAQAMFLLARIHSLAHPVLHGFEFQLRPPQGFNSATWPVWSMRQEAARMVVAVLRSDTESAAAVSMSAAGRIHPSDLVMSVAGIELVDSWIGQDIGLHGGTVVDVALVSERFVVPLYTNVGEVSGIGMNSTRSSHATKGGSSDIHNNNEVSLLHEKEEMKKKKDGTQPQPQPQQETTTSSLQVRSRPLAVALMVAAAEVKDASVAACTTLEALSNGRAPRLAQQSQSAASRLTAAVKNVCMVMDVVLKDTTTTTTTNNNNNNNNNKGTPAHHVQEETTMGDSESASATRKEEEEEEQERSNASERDPVHTALLEQLLSVEEELATSRKQQMDLSGQLRVAKQRIKEMMVEQHRQIQRTTNDTLLGMMSEQKVAPKLEDGPGQSVIRTMISPQTANKTAVPTSTDLVLLEHRRYRRAMRDRLSDVQIDTRAVRSSLGRVRDAIEKVFQQAFDDTFELITLLTTPLSVSQSNVGHSTPSGGGMITNANPSGGSPPAGVDTRIDGHMNGLSTGTPATRATAVYSKPPLFTAAAGALLEQKQVSASSSLYTHTKSPTALDREKERFVRLQQAMSHLMQELSRARVYCVVEAPKMKRKKKSERDGYNANSPMAVHILDHRSVSVSGPLDYLIETPTQQVMEDSRSFMFDRVFPTVAPGEGEEGDGVDSGSHVSAEVTSAMTDLVHAVVGGGNACVMAYGSSRKSKILRGSKSTSSSDPGVIALMVRELFTAISLATAAESLTRVSNEQGQEEQEQHQQGEESVPACLYEVSVTAVEVRDDKMRDLLRPTSSLLPSSHGRSRGNQSGGRTVTVQTDTATGQTRIVNATAVRLQAAGDFENIVAIVINERMRRRASGGGHLDSHFCIRVSVEHVGNNVPTAATSRLSRRQYRNKTGVLTFVDFAQPDAGSVRSSNRGLAAFNDVVSALTAHSKYIPYRNSKLTHMLQDSLGRGAKLALMVTVRSELKHRTDTLRSLQFASKMKACDNL